MRIPSPKQPTQQESRPSELEMESGMEVQRAMTDPRVRVSLTVTVPTGNYSSVRLELMEERDVSSIMNEHQTRQTIVQQLAKEVEDWKKKQAGITALPSSSPTALPKTLPKPDVASERILQPKRKSPPTDAPKSTPGTVSAVTDQIIIEELENIDWIDNSKRTGWFASLEEIPFPIRAALMNKFLAASNKSVRIGDFNYTRFGDKNNLIGKFPAVKK